MVNVQSYSRGDSRPAFGGVSWSAAHLGQRTVETMPRAFWCRAGRQWPLLPLGNLASDGSLGAVVVVLGLDVHSGGRERGAGVARARWVEDGVVVAACGLMWPTSLPLPVLLVRPRLAVRAATLAVPAGDAAAEAAPSSQSRRPGCCCFGRRHLGGAGCVLGGGRRAPLVRLVVVLVHVSVLAARALTHRPVRSRSIPTGAEQQMKLRSSAIPSPPSRCRPRLRPPLPAG